MAVGRFQSPSVVSSSLRQCTVRSKFPKSISTSTLKQVHYGLGSGQSRFQSASVRASSLLSSKFITLKQVHLTSLRTRKRSVKIPKCSASVVSSKFISHYGLGSGQSRFERALVVSSRVHYSQASLVRRRSVVSKLHRLSQAHYGGVRSTFPKSISTCLVGRRKKQTENSRKWSSITYLACTVRMYTCPLTPAFYLVISAQHFYCPGNFIQGNQIQGL